MAKRLPVDASKARHRPIGGNELWDKFFTVKMLYLHSRSVDTVRKYGVRVSGVDEIDRHLDKQEIITQLNIDAMFEKHRMGVTIKVLKYDDSAEIYRIIHNHLIAWAEFLSKGINVGDAPLKDLIELDAFAAVVYSKAKCVFSQQERVSAISTNYGNIQAFNFHNILKRATVDEIRSTATGIDVSKRANEAQSKVVPERSSLKDIFASELSRVEGWRGKIHEGDS